MKKDDTLIAYVDGSYSSVKKTYSYGCVILLNGEPLEELAGTGSSYAEMRNVAGEIKGAMRAVQWAVSQAYPSITIFHDYEGVAKWPQGLWKAKLEGTRKYRDYMRRAGAKINITFKKVKAHSGDTFNERADELAREALTDLSQSQKNDFGIVS